LIIPPGFIFTLPCGVLSRFVGVAEEKTLTTPGNKRKGHRFEEVDLLIENKK